MSDIKDLLNDIISDTNKSYPEKTTPETNPTLTFDSGAYREKLSLGVLHDIVSAMMHDDTANMDEAIDEAIKKHLKEDCNCTGYEYLKRSVDVSNAPMDSCLGSIVQEIDNKTNSTAQKICTTKDASCATVESADIKDLTKDVKYYEGPGGLREKIKSKVSEQVANDVAGVLTKGNDAPVFSNDKINEELDKKKKENVEEVTNESTILRMCGVIVQESMNNGVNMSVEEGIERACIVYSINEMDKLFKQRPRVNIVAKYSR